MAAGTELNHVRDWVQRSEDNLNLSMWSDTIINMPEHGRTSPDEAVSLRFQNIRRGTMDPAKRKGVIAAGAVFLLIGAVTFVGVYSSFGSSSTDGGHVKSLSQDDEIKALPYSDLDQPQGDQPRSGSSLAVTRGSKPLKTFSGHVFVPDRKKPDVQSQIASREDPTSLTPVPLRTRTLRTLNNPEQQPLSGATRVNDTDVTTTAKPKTKKKKNKIQHHRRTLPSDASTKPPISLLYQMKLLPSATRINDITKFTHCEHHFDDKKFFKGWRASLSINATVAQIKEDQNTFIGYGKNRNLAKLMAAQFALMAIYPGNLTYAIDGDAVSAIKPYCDDNDAGN